MKSHCITNLGFGTAVLIAFGLASNIWAAEYILNSSAEEVPRETKAEAEESSNRTQKKTIVIQKLEPGGLAEQQKREVAWLGVATEESSEALSSQLGLKPGAGLVVTFVSADSPAAKAGLKKNDVLVEFDQQQLVHPAQFRKLVQMRKEGDTVVLKLYRSGKEEEVSIKLGKTDAGLAILTDENSWDGSLRDLRLHLKELPVGEVQERIREEMKQLREGLAKAGIDRKSIEVEVKRSVEEAQRALQKALRQATNAHRTFGPAVRQMEEIVKRGVDVDKDATIVVKSHRNEVRTMVKTDDTGTYVMVADPVKRLTAHTKEGKLAFEGEIETPEQQGKVPRDIWEKVQPMLKELEIKSAESSEPEQDEEFDTRKNLREE